jgi:opacity protein-like surface antigen
MRTGFLVVLSFVFAFLISSASTAQAQDTSWGDLAVSAGRIDFDLSGTGHARGLVVRTTRHLSSHVNLEFRGLYAEYCGDQIQGECVPNQLSGSTSLFVPEAQLQYRWNVGRVSPYIGGGIGAARVKSSLDTQWDPTFSAAVGTAVYLTDRLGITGEFRLRGHEARFTGTTSEITAGVVWRLPAF